MTCSFYTSFGPSGDPLVWRDKFDRTSPERRELRHLIITELAKAPLEDRVREGEYQRRSTMRYGDDNDRAIVVLCIDSAGVTACGGATFLSVEAAYRATVDAIIEAARKRDAERAKIRERKQARALRMPLAAVGGATA